MRRIRGRAYFITLFAILVAPMSLLEAAEAWKTGPAFQKALAQPYQAVWQGSELLDILRQTGRLNGVVILLDRHIDPHAIVTADPDGGTLEASLRQLKADAPLGVAVTEPIVYVGPPAAADTLRTVLARRHEELEPIRTRGTSGAKRLWTNRRTIQWVAATSPEEIVRQIEKAFSLTVSADPPLPHDLWRAGTLPEVTAAEALTFVLHQSDRTFSVGKEGDRVAIRPLTANDLEIRRLYPVAKGSPSATVARWRELVPDLRVEVVGNQLAVTGTVETHERLSGAKPPAVAKPGKGPAPTVLARRRFTLRAQQIPLEALMKELEKSGVAFEYDADVLEQAGVDLSTRINVNVENVSADEFFRQVLKPAGLSGEIDGLTVTLKPAS